MLFIYSYVYNNLFTAGATSVAELIQTKSTLNLLMLSTNNLSDDGITAIAGALAKSNINTLEINECGITVTGAKVLAESLLYNKSITTLMVLKNPITLEGARVILESAVGNGVCDSVSMDIHLYGDNDEAQSMMETLQLRHRRNFLKVGIHVFYVTGIIIKWVHCRDVKNVMMKMKLLLARPPRPSMSPYYYFSYTVSCLNL